MKIYNILRWYRRIKSPRVKLLGILGLHVLRRRYLFLAFDPSLTCNLRCRLCYFSNPSEARDLHGTFSADDIEAIAHSLFHRTLKLQIGCGAEPTTYRRLPELVSLAHTYGIPNISVTTNGKLLTRQLLSQLVTNGLTELIISTHGLSKDTYETMMRGASIERFTQLIADIGEVRKEHPQLLVRINYTVCIDNIRDLSLLPATFSAMKPDVIQLRPVQDIGSTDYADYSMTPLRDLYDECILPAIAFCECEGITCIYPQPGDLTSIAADNSPRQHLNQVVEMLPYFNLAPFEGWREKIDPYEETFEQYSRRTHRVGTIMRHFFGMGVGKRQEEDATKTLNYTVK